MIGVLISRDMLVYVGLAALPGQLDVWPVAKERCKDIMYIARCRAGCLIRNPTRRSKPGRS